MSDASQSLAAEAFGFESPVFVPEEEESDFESELFDSPEFSEDAEAPFFFLP